MGRKVGLALLAAVLAGSGSVAAGTLPASADTLTQVTASQLVNDMGAGWNLGNQLEANANGIPGETAWGNPTITQSFIDKVKATGFKTIRIPVSYLGYIGSGPDYTVSTAWLDRIQAVVDYAYGRGLYVVINMHGDGYKSVNGSWLICDASDQTTIKAKYQKVWQQIATRFAGYNEHLILESMNEEFDGQYGNPTQPCYSNINAYNQIFVDTVRQTGGNNGSRWLLIPGWNTNIDYTVGNYGFSMPTDRYRSSAVPSGQQRLMISAHYYDPWDFAGEESGNITQWGPSATNPSRKSTWGQQDYMDGQLKKLHDTFVTQGYPVLIGEYGSVDKTSADPSNNVYRADFAHTLVAAAKKYGLATTYWDNGYNGPYGFGLFNRSSATVTQQGIVDAIMSAAGGSTSTTTTTTTTTSARATTTTTTTSARPTTTTTTSSSGTSNAAVTWTVESSWQGGLQATLKVTNTGTSTINGWTVGATLPAGQTIQQVYNGSFTQSGQQATITNASYNGTIAPGASASTGIAVSWTTNNGPATNLTLNGQSGGGTTTTTTSARPTTTTTTTAPTTPPTSTTTTTTTTTRPTTTTGGTGTKTCSATITPTGSWSGAWQAEVKVTAGAAAIAGWTVSWTFPNGSLSSAWNATASGTTSVTATDAGWNGSLAAAASTTWGFIAGGTPSTPTVTCTAR